MAIVIHGTNGITFGDNSSLISASSAGVQWQSVQTTDFNAIAGKAYPIDTTSGVIVATLPASPEVGDQITFTDYASTFATNKLSIDPNGQNLIGTPGLKNIAINSTTVSLIYVDSTMGWISYSNVQPVPTYSVDMLVVAGGGGGGGSSSDNVAGGGGAGGGGFLYSTNQTVFSGTQYAVTIGAGGSGGAKGFTGSKGTDSSFAALIVALGGGAGRDADDFDVSISNGGSGGGASGSSGGAAGSGTAGQGYGGGSKNDSNAGNYAGGGGGGAGGAGSGRSPGPGAANSISGTSVTYAAGGYGQGTSNFINAGVSGASNTGDGGNGGSNGGASGGAGGSGIVIIRYLGTQQASGGSVTSSNGYTIHTFTTSGTFTA